MGCVVIQILWLTEVPETIRPLYEKIKQEMLQ